MARNPERIDDLLHELRTYWVQHSDLRLTQVLVNLDIVPNTPGFWYYTEDDTLIEYLRKGNLRD